MAICIAIALVYGRVIHHDFLYFDDIIDVSGNPQVARGLTLDGVRWAFTSFEHTNWVPLTRISHMAVRQLFGNHAGAGLLLNMCLHMAVTVVLFLTLHRMTGHLWQSALVAAIFALHPLRVESVAWLTERKDVLSGLFWMLSMHAYATYAGHPSLAGYIRVAVWFVLGLLSKPMVMTLPAVLLLLDYWPLNRFRTGQRIRCIKEKIPLLVLSAASAGVTIAAHASTGALHPLSESSMGHRLQTAVVAYAGYLGKTLLPVNLAAFYSVPESYPAAMVAGALAVLVLITAGICLLAGHRYLTVGWLWFLGTLVPVIGLLNWGFHLMADRFTYLPAIGLLTALVWGVDTLRRRLDIDKRFGAAAAALIIATLATSSWMQVAYWKDSITLFTHAVRVSPRNWWGLLALGSAYANEGHPDRSVRYYAEAIAIRPNHAPAHVMMGRDLSRMNRIALALKHLDRALAIDPDLADAWIEKGEILLRTDRKAAAKACLEQALALKPKWAAALFLMGNLMAAEGRLDAAAGYYRQSLATAPDSAAAHNNLAVVLVRMGSGTEAAKHMAQALSLQPDAVRIRKNMETINGVAPASRNNGHQDSR